MGENLSEIKPNCHAKFIGKASVEKSVTVHKNKQKKVTVNLVSRPILSMAA